MLLAFAPVAVAALLVILTFRVRAPKATTRAEREAVAASSREFG